MKNSEQKNATRRAFLQTTAKITGAAVLFPSISCSPKGTASSMSQILPVSGLTLPETLPDNWDPVSFNRVRGESGKIPSEYMKKINAADGIPKHLGKHLPYIPQLENGLVPAGFVALMFGDPSKGYARHPNAIRSSANQNQGHWYNWIKLSKAAPSSTEITSTYSNWPGIEEGDSGSYAVFGDANDPLSDGGRNTIYLAKLPVGLQKGDKIRMWAHCLTHGEYVDFLTLES